MKFGKNSGLFRMDQSELNEEMLNKAACFFLSHHPISTDIYQKCADILAELDCVRQKLVRK